MTYRTPGGEPLPHREPLWIDEREICEAISQWIRNSIPNRNKIITEVRLKHDPDTGYSATIIWTTPP